MVADEHSDLEVVDLADRVSHDERPGRLQPPEPRTARRRSVRWWWALGAVVVLVVVWVVGAVFSLLSARGDVQDAREDLLEGRDALEAGEVELALERFDTAAETLGGLPDRVTSPWLGPIRLVPTYDRTLDVVATLGEAGGLAAGAARDVTDQLAGVEGGLGVLTPRDGQVPVGEIAALAPTLEQAAEDADAALELAEETDVSGIDQAVVDARAEFIELLAPAAEDLSSAAEVADVLPAMLGADGPRRYLVLAANPTEARGSAGFFGAFTVLEADAGRMSFAPVREVQTLPVLEPGEVAWSDPSLAERYDLYGGSVRIRSMNMTPHFPAAAQTTLNYWEAARDEQLDGVISVDTFAFESLLQVSGPVEVAGLGAIDADSVVEFVSYDAYQRITDAELRKRLIGDVAITALQGFLDGPGDIEPAEVLGAFGDMARRESLLAYSPRVEEQELLEELGLAGEFDTGPGDLLAVITNSGSGSKIDYYLDRQVRYDVELADDGRVDAVVSAGFTNNAPTSGELTYMIGPPSQDVGFGAGDNILLSSVYCAPGCSFFEVPDIGYADLPTTQGEELGFGVASTWMRLPSMRSRELIYSYTVPDVWTETEDGTLRYQLRYQHQVAIRPTQLDIRVRVPDGYEAVTLPEDATVADGHVVISTEAMTDLDYLVEFTAEP